MKSPDFVSYASAVRKPPLLIILFSSVVVAAQQTSAPTPDKIATYPATLHEQLGPSCELTQPVTLIQYKQYDALVLADSTDETYSPEIRKGDFVALSAIVPKEAVKSAKKSGFEVRAESTEISGLNSKPMTNGSSCPDSQQVIAEAHNRRYERRFDLQRRLREVGSDGVLPPVIIQQVQPEPVANQKAPRPSGQQKVKFQGTVILLVVVGVEGKVQNVRVTQSLDAVLDKKAVEAVQQWKFSPARMKGLPVSAQIAVEVAFHLY